MSWSIFSSPEQINTGDNWKATQKDYSISHCNQESIVSTCMPSVRVQPSSWQEMLIDKTKYLYKLVIYLSRKEGGLTNVKIVIFRGQCPLNWFQSHWVVQVMRRLGIWLTMQLRMSQGVWAIFCHNSLVDETFLCDTAKNHCPATCIRATVTSNRSLFGIPPGTSLIPIIIICTVSMNVLQYYYMATTESGADPGF